MAESTSGEAEERSGAAEWRLGINSDEKVSAGTIRRPGRPSVLGGAEVFGPLIRPGLADSYGSFRNRHVFEKNRLGPKAEFPKAVGDGVGLGSCRLLYPSERKVVAVRDVASEESSLNNFGLVIAYVLPGFTALQGFPLLAPGQAAWGTGGDPNPPLTAFLSGTVMALAAGLTVSAVRWFVIDRLHHWTGLRKSERDFARLEKNVAAFEFLVLVHYRYYKFYANMVVALVWSYATRDYLLGWRGALDLPLVLLFFLASRDSLRKYYERTGELLGRPVEPLVVSD